MDRCRYCKREIKRGKARAFLVCECSKAQEEWVLCMEIQSTRKRLSELNKELSELRDDGKHKPSSKSEVEL